MKGQLKRCDEIEARLKKPCARPVFEDPRFLIKVRRVEADCRPGYKTSTFTRDDCISMGANNVKAVLQERELKKAGYKDPCKFVFMVPILMQRASFFP